MKNKELKKTGAMDASVGKTATVEGTTVSVGVKTSLGHDKRRFQLAPGSRIEDLHRIVAAVHALDTASATLRTCWTDEDGDRITIATTDDLVEAVRWAAATDTRLLRIDVAAEDNGKAAGGAAAADAGVPDGAGLVIAGPVVVPSTDHDGRKVAEDDGDDGDDELKASGLSTLLRSTSKNMMTST